MIYEQFFELNQRPFSIAPNPLFLYQQGQYREALAALEYGLYHKGGFVLLTGEVGTGKTTLCKQLLKNIPSDTEVALILHPQLDRVEFLQAICREFGISLSVESDSRRNSEIELINLIHQFLLATYSEGKNAVLVIDEAQHLDHSVLELVRLLTNLETSEEKLLQIILIGQPELKVRLDKYELRQLNQRITVRFHLKPLSRKALVNYIGHRLSVASEKPVHGHLFTTGSLMLLHKLTQGIPRLVNVVADRALMAAYADNKKRVGVWLLYKAAKEVLAESQFKWQKPFTKAFMLGSVGGVAVAGFMAMQLLQNPNTEKPINVPLADNVSSIFKAVENQFSPVLNYADLADGWLVDRNAVCEAPRSCWQGLLPADLLLSASIEALVQIEGKWVRLSKAQNIPDMVNTKVVWLPPFEFKAALKIGDKSQNLSWIQQRLGMESSQSTTAESVDEGWELIQPDNGQDSLVQIGLPEFDWMLEEQVKQYQSSLGLTVDGVVGSQTLLALWLSEQALQHAEFVGEL